MTAGRYCIPSILLLFLSLKLSPIAFGVEAALEDWVVRTVKSIPAIPKNNFTYLAIPALLIDLYGYL